jgi:hypothetical protein
MSRIGIDRRRRLRKGHRFGRTGFRFGFNRFAMGKQRIRRQSLGTEHPFASSKQKQEQANELAESTPHTFLYRTWQDRKVKEILRSARKEREDDENVPIKVFCKLQ